MRLQWVLRSGPICSRASIRTRTLRDLAEECRQDLVAWARLALAVQALAAQALALRALAAWLLDLACEACRREVECRQVVLCRQAARCRAARWGQGLADLEVLAGQVVHPDQADLAGQEVLALADQVDPWGRAARWGQAALWAEGICPCCQQGHFSPWRRCLRT